MARNVSAWEEVQEGRNLIWHPEDFEDKLYRISIPTQNNPAVCSVIPVRGITVLKFSAIP